MHKWFRISQPGSDYEILAVNVEIPVGWTFGNWIKIHAQLSSTYDPSTANALRPEQNGYHSASNICKCIWYRLGLMNAFLSTQTEVRILSKDHSLTHSGPKKLDDILQSIFKLIISIKKVFHWNVTEACCKVSSWHESALVQVMVWCQMGAKPLPKPSDDWVSWRKHPIYLLCSGVFLFPQTQLANMECL